MIKAGRHFCIFLFVLFGVAAASCEVPVEATVCQLKDNPPAYNHKLVKVTGFVSHAFEDFSIFDPSCPSWPWVWLEYGGTAKSGTMYCCGVTADRSRSKELVIEDVPITLTEDEEFKAFDKRIQPPFQSGRQGAVIHATLVGRYFAGKRIEYSEDHPWGGFGHMGCCTLLAIEKVDAADTQIRPELDYGASADQPDIDQAGCGFRDLLPLEQTEARMRWQREAEEGQRKWAFDDPKRVASDVLFRLTETGPSAEAMKLTHTAQGRKVYRWKPAGKPVSYMVVVSRPYWLSFYSHDANRIAWAPIAAYELSCGGKNTVTRIK